ncbi:MAG: hypothetical protein IH989_08390 [Planctomycetes bacterium]|nr:hypothetical protein [Planctomycetota bacterium]
MRKKKALRVAAAVAMTGCLMQANCLTINPRALNNFTNELLSSVISDVNLGGIISGLISDAISGALP